MEKKTGCDLSKYEDPRQKARVEISLPRLELIDIIDGMLIKIFDLEGFQCHQIQIHLLNSHPLIGHKWFPSPQIHIPFLLVTILGCVSWRPITFLCGELGGHTAIAHEKSLAVREPSVTQLEAFYCTIE